MTIAHRTVVADSRLTSRHQLASQLGVRETASDAELILRAYLKWGRGCVERLHGDFAFCIVDRDHLFCARDRLGAKPFYYGLNLRQFMFASEAKPIADLTGRAINEQRLADFLVFPMEHVDGRSTFYKGVFRLPAATAMTVSNGEASCHRYWKPEICVNEGLSEQDCIDEFRELAYDAIRERTGNELPISLSGGLDSSFLAGLASQTMTVKSFSTVAGAEQDCEETRFIELLVDQQKLDATLISPEQMDTIDKWLHEQLSHLTEPFDNNMLQMLLIYRFAAEAGCDVIADGVEGDLTYSLPDNYAAGLIKAGCWREGVKEMLAQRQHRYGAPHSIFSVVQETARYLGSGWFPWSKRKIDPGSLIRPEFAKDTDVCERLAQMSRRFSSLEEAVLYRAQHPAITAALERYDRVAAQVGLEAIHPLLDSRLIDFSLSLPWHFRNRNGWAKYLIRRAGENLVPDKVRWQTGKPENAWIFNQRYFDRHWPEMREMIAAHRHLLAPYVAGAVLDEPDDDAIWHLYTLACWMERADR